jgi:hypothetical protein
LAREYNISRANVIGIRDRGIDLKITGRGEALWLVNE